MKAVRNGTMIIPPPIPNSAPRNPARIAVAESGCNESEGNYDQLENL